MALLPAHLLDCYQYSVPKGTYLYGFQLLIRIY